MQGCDLRQFHMISDLLARLQSIIVVFANFTVPSFNSSITINTNVLGRRWVSVWGLTFLQRAMRMMRKMTAMTTRANTAAKTATWENRAADAHTEKELIQEENLSVPYSYSVSKSQRLSQRLIHFYDFICINMSVKCIEAFDQCTLNRL